MPRKARSEQELTEAGEHFGYEIQQLCLTFLAISNRILLGVPLYNAALESFLLHYRNVRDFLYPKSRDNDDDVLAVDFLATVDSWPYISTNWVEVAEKETERLNRAVHHLSYSRLKYAKEDKTNWPVKEMLAAVIAAFERFTSTVDTRNRARFNTAASHIELTKRVLPKTASPGN